MGTTTTNLSLYKPAAGETGYDALFGTSMDTIDDIPGKPRNRTGLTGATSATRYVGGTASVAPTTGTFEVGDYVITQTGHIFICTAAGSPGTWRDVLEFADIWLPFTIEGTLTAPTLNGKKLPVPYACTVVGMRVAVETAPTGASLIVDLWRNGTTTMFSSIPTITAGNTVSSSIGTVIGSPTVSTSQWLQVRVNQVGSTVAGAGLTGVIVLRRS